MTSTAKIKVAVLFGGCSTEYEVSLRSASAVIASLNRHKYDVLLMGITRRGEWRKYDGPLEMIANDTWARHASCVPAILSPDRDVHGIVVMKDGGVSTIRIDVAFPVLHGKHGEDGTVQGLLALAGIPCVGCGTLSSAVCMDKDVAHRLVRHAGIPTAPSVVLTSAVADGELLELTAALRCPLFVKPANAGSSLGITRVQQRGELPGAVATAFEHDAKVVIEEGVDGFEVGCAIIGDEELVIGGPDEVELAGGFFDYAEKYTMKTSAVYMPARVDEAVAEQIRRAAATIYRALGCTGLARVDLFVTADKRIVFNEVNTIPGFTPHSRYANMLRGAGMSFEQITDALIELAVKR